MTERGLVKRYWPEAILAAALALPWISLIGLGLVWLWQQNALLPWTIGAAVLGLAAIPLLPARGRETPAAAKEAVAAMVPDAPDWDRNAKTALEAVRTIAETATPLTFDDLDQALNLGQRTIEAVAAVYHPDRPHAWAHFTLPEALLLTEHLAATLRRETLRSFPGARVFRLDHVLRIREGHHRYGSAVRWVTRVGWRVTRIGRVVLSPASALAAEAKALVLDRTSTLLSERARRHATRLLVIELGRTAIELYSGRLVLSATELSDAAAAEAVGATEASDDAPLRVMLAGAINAGKSSTLNALAGEIRGEVSPLPGRNDVVEHIVRQDGKPVLVLVDPPGIGPDAARNARLETLAHRADMVLWVISATQPARQSDVAALRALRSSFAAELDRRPPPILVVLTHIDQLRPAAEWNPPYNVVTPRGRKETMIAEALREVARELDMPEDAVVPVALAPGRDTYNIDMLWGSIAQRLAESRSRQLERIRAGRSGLSLREVAGQLSGSVRLITRMVTKG